MSCWFCLLNCLYVLVVCVVVNVIMFRFVRMFSFSQSTGYFSSSVQNKVYRPIYLFNHCTRPACYPMPVQAWTVAVDEWFGRLLEELDGKGWWVGTVFERFGW